MNWTKLPVVFLVAWCCSFVGCIGSGEEQLAVVKLDPNAIGASIVQEFDTDGDGEVSPAELKKCKGLLMLTAGERNLMPKNRLDSDGNGSVSAEEFAAKLAACFEGRRWYWSGIVKYKGKPLEGATVSLVPEAFMGDGVPTASGLTDELGQVAVTGEDGVTGAIPGIYRVEITHPDKNLAAKYNTDTMFSIALDPTNPYNQEGTPEFRVN